MRCGLMTTAQKVANILAKLQARVAEQARLGDERAAYIEQLQQKVAAFTDAERAEIEASEDELFRPDEDELQDELQTILAELAEDARIDELYAVLDEMREGDDKDARSDLRSVLDGTAERKIG